MPASRAARVTMLVVLVIATACSSSRSASSHVITALITGLQDGKSYQITVAAQNAIGLGAATQKTTPIIVGAPGQPGRPIAVKIGPGSLRVSFARPSNDGATITGYTMTCTSPTSGMARAASGPSSPLTITGLTPRSFYSCTVKATNSRGTGPASTASAAVTA